MSENGSLYDNGFGDEDNLKVQKLVQFLKKTSNILAILKKANSYDEMDDGEWNSTEKRLLNDYVICRFLVDKKPIEEATKFLTNEDKQTFLLEIKKLQSSLVINYDEGNEEIKDEMVDIVPIPQPVSSSKKRKQNHQNIKELNNDELIQFELNKSIVLTPQYEYEFMDDGTIKEGFNSNSKSITVEPSVLKKKNSIPKVLKPTNSLIKPTVKKELAAARKLGKLLSPKKDIEEITRISVEKETLESDEEQKVFEETLLEDDEIMISAAKFGGPSFLFA